MDARELLRTWPDWQRAGTETVLASPAWRMSVRMGGVSAALTPAPSVPGDLLVLDVTLDGEPHRLALADSPACPDLHLLWSRRDELPEALLLALAEKECGGVFGLVETVVRRMLAVKGLSAGSGDGLRFFSVAAAETGFVFGLDVTPDLAATLGRLENLDPAHPSIRASTRPARAVLGRMAVADEDVAALAPGAYLLLPEDFGNDAKWVPADDLEADDGLLLVAPGAYELTFAAMADGDFPPIPDGPASELLRGGRPVCRCTESRVGQARALKVLEMCREGES